MFWRFAGDSIAASVDAMSARRVRVVKYMAVVFYLTCAVKILEGV